MATAKEIRLKFQQFVEAHSLDWTVRVKYNNIFFKQPSSIFNKYVMIGYSNSFGALLLDETYRSVIEIKPIENAFRKAHKNNGIKQSFYYTFNSDVLFANFKEQDLLFEGISSIENGLKSALKFGKDFLDKFNTFGDVFNYVNHLDENTDLHKSFTKPTKLRKLGVLALANDPSYLAYRERVQIYYEQMFNGEYAYNYQNEKLILKEMLQSIENLRTR